MDEGHRALRTRVGQGLRHEGLRLVRTSQLCQDHLGGALRRRCWQALFPRQPVVWGLGKGLLEEGLKQGELARVDLGGMMPQGKPSVGPLFMEWNSVRPQTLLILWLCHP